MMSKGWLRFLKLFILFISAWGQSSTKDSFPLVGFDDYSPEIPLTLQKKFTTTLALIPLYPEVVFNEDTFCESVQPYYDGLNGFVHLSVSSTADVNSDWIQVTYEVYYDYTTLLSSPGISDDLIQEKIGTYENVVSGIKYDETAIVDFKNKELSSVYEPFSTNTILDEYINAEQHTEGSGSPITQDYDFPATDKYFSFTGSSLCEVLDCGYAYVSCNETLNGISVNCTSPCKLEKCLNNAECMQAEPQNEAQCMCPSTNNVWYVGENCQTMINDWMVILVLVLCGLLILVVICLSVILCRKTAKSDEQKKSDHVLFPSTGFYSRKPSKVSFGQEMKLKEIEKSYNDFTKSRHKRNDYYQRNSDKYCERSRRYRKRSSRQRSLNYRREIEVKQRTKRRYSDSDSSSSYSKPSAAKCNFNSISSISPSNGEFNLAQKHSNSKIVSQAEDSFDTFESETTASEDESKETVYRTTALTETVFQTHGNSLTSSVSPKRKSPIRWFPVDKTFAFPSSNSPPEADLNIRLKWRNPSYNLHVYDNCWEADV